jgi:hypothetical protein
MSLGRAGISPNEIMGDERAAGKRFSILKGKEIYPERLSTLVQAKSFTHRI